MKKIISILIIFCILIPSITFAHPGRTDSKGCHTCKTRCTERWGLKYGEYHCHTPKVAKRSSRRYARRSK